MHDTPLRPSPDVRASITDDGLVLLDLSGGLVLSSNVVGGRIWQLIEQQRTPTTIAQQLVAEYAIPLERARADVDAFIASLRERGLVGERQS